MDSEPAANNDTQIDLALPRRKGARGPNRPNRPNRAAGGVSRCFKLDYIDSVKFPAAAKGKPSWRRVLVVERKSLALACADKVLSIHHRNDDDHDDRQARSLRRDLKWLQLATRNSRLASGKWQLAATNTPTNVVCGEPKLTLGETKASWSGQRAPKRLFIRRAGVLRARRHSDEIGERERERKKRRKERKCCQRKFRYNTDKQARCYIAEEVEEDKKDKKDKQDKSEKSKRKREKNAYLALPNNLNRLARRPWKPSPGRTSG